MNPYFILSRPRSRAAFSLQRYSCYSVLRGTPPCARIGHASPAVSPAWGKAQTLAPWAFSRVLPCGRSKGRRPARASDPRFLPAEGPRVTVFCNFVPAELHIRPFSRNVILSCVISAFHALQHQKLQNYSKFKGVYPHKYFYRFKPSGF